MGAEIIEKHVTIDRDLKGSDHKGSLSVVGIEKMVRDIRNLERALGKETLFESEAIKETKLKLERSLASNCPIKKGELITIDKLHLLSPGTGFKWNQKDLVLNKKAKMTISKDEIINKEHI
jgi:sialic acid synthase